MNKTMRFGPVGKQVDIPYPESGMGFDSNLKIETVDLLSGGVSVYRSPTAHKKLTMTWKGGRNLGTPLQPLIDVYEGMYGRGPFYLTDPQAVNGNLLPPRWASSYMLGYLGNGWCNPVISAQTTTPEGQQVKFTGSADFASEGTSLVVPTVQGATMFLNTWGTLTGASGIRVYRHNASTGAWTLGFTDAPSLTNDAPLAVISGSEALAGTYDALRLVAYCPTGTTLTLQHMDLAVNSYLEAPAPFRAGLGVGALQFTGNLGGTLTSAVIDRIGLSLDMTEVERDANFS